MRIPDPNFWRNKKVLLTGHSGFKGSWTTILLREMGAEIIGLSLPPNTNPSLFKLAKIDSLCESYFTDIRDQEKLNNLIKKISPDIVIHMAALPLVRESYLDPIATFNTNIMGTVNVLDSLIGIDNLRTVICVTTDKVYANQNTNKPYKEEDRLGGHDPYSASKAASEIVISCYRNAFLIKQGVGLASVRAGNVIGGGDWSKDRIIPDAIRAWENGEELKIRSPESIRPWQHVLEPIVGYLILAEELYANTSLSGAYNFGPDTTDKASVKEVINIAKSFFPSAEVIYKTPEVNFDEDPFLLLDNSKIKSSLGIYPVWNCEQAIKRSINWYLAQKNGGDSLKLCQQDFLDFRKKD